MAAPRLVGGCAVWLQGMADGRMQLMRRGDGGAVEALLPDGYSCGSRVNEYGGGAWAAAPDGVRYAFVNAADQGLCIWERGAVRRVAGVGGGCIGDLVWHLRGILYVAERPGAAGGAAVHSICMVDVDGDGVERRLASGADFYSSPQVSADGRRLAFVRWGHPQMPWQGSEVWVADMDGAAVRRVAGGGGCSALAPLWDDGGVLHYVCDGGGWWNIWRHGADGGECLFAERAEYAAPAWELGVRHYGFLGDGRVLAARCCGGRWGLVEIAGGDCAAVAGDVCAVADMHVADGRALVLGADEGRAMGLYEVDGAGAAALGAGVAAGAAGFGSPRPVRIEGRDCQGFYYAPDGDVAGGDGDGGLPPLIVACHGGPTAMADPSLNLKVRFWTSRGFAWLDLNYSGSSGFGRAHRQRLDGGWGEVEVADCAAAARQMVAEGLAHPQRLLIRGSSAGGFTALCALCDEGPFAAGCSLYGIADLEALRRQSPKFESHYLDSLVGAWPEQAERYGRRSPLVRGLRRPALLLQGLDDRVVWPEQSRALAAASDDGMVELVEYPGEGHGFRRADTIEDALRREHDFYLRTLGI